MSKDFNDMTWHWLSGTGGGGRGGLLTEIGFALYAIVDRIGQHTLPYMSALMNEHTH